MVPWLAHDDPFPSVERALNASSGAPGLLAASADLLPARLYDAYQHGIFPWYSDGQPVLWWSPDPRMVLKPTEFKLSDFLRKTLKRVARDPIWEVRVDDDFAAVMGECADTPRLDQRGTWITSEIVEAYSTLHRAGQGHSIETWYDGHRVGGHRVGGLYGVSFRRMFFGESMFAHKTDASKIALSALVGHLRRHKIEMIDYQQHTSHLASLGCREIPRREFVAHLKKAARETQISWRFDKSVLTDLLEKRPPTQAP
ncbi:Leucyl/phenylalanyl-tRNA- protein transferase [Candidatus Burkholderia brachyanthoides]|nr:Leucyl/phenylalanyl-tRNA- protein transferase [Candidatus Burkholderia brachyanthoides]